MEGLDLRTTLQLGDLLVAVYKELKARAERDLRPYGIGMGQLHILVLFYSSPERALSQAELARELRIDKGNVSRSVSKLLGKGYLEPVSENGRAYRLSGEGKRLKADILACFGRLQASMTAGIGARALEQAKEVLAKSLDNLEGIA